ncbi:MAG: ABC transporter substrate-binding protein, partial [Candidatus Dormibacterales bacterium]
GLDYAFGWINVGSFVHAFEQLGGHIDKMLWAPITTADYSPFIPQIPTTTQAVFALAAGAASARLTKAYASFGLKKKTPLIGTTTLTDYSALPGEDPSAILGVNVAAQYCDGIPSATNTKFASEYFAAYHTYPGYYSDAGYTKYRLLITALRALHGDTSNAQKLIHTLKSTPIQAPRGPVTLNPATWSPNENIYICEVENVHGALRNVPIHTYKDVKPWGYLSEAQWKTWFSEDAGGRPSA